MAAPALAASIADCAICAGVTGTAGLRPGVSAEPVTAHEIMTLRCIPPSQGTNRALQRSLARGRGRAQSVAWAARHQAGAQVTSSSIRHARAKPTCTDYIRNWIGETTARRVHHMRGKTRRTRFGRPAACLALCTALRLLRPSLERIRSEGDFASAYGTLAAGRHGAFRTGPPHRR